MSFGTRPAFLLLCGLLLGGVASAAHGAECAAPPKRLTMLTRAAIRAHLDRDLPAVTGALLGELPSNGVPWTGRYACEHGYVVIVEAPAVDVPSVELGMGFLRPGDRVLMRAGGCVQTMGHGKTWKRYVDPVTSYPELYRGTVQVPGVTDGLEPLAAVVDQMWSVQASDSGHVRLGYNDDDYLGNGYCRPDRGVERQCEGQGVAYTVMFVDTLRAAAPRVASRVDVVGIGTSVTWGQGLWDRDKVVSRVADSLRTRWPGTLVRRRLLAHSGARLTLPEDEPAKPRYGPELPGPVPLLDRQLDEALNELNASDSTRAQLVIVDGGINDVDVRYIVGGHGLDSTQVLRRIDSLCTRPMREFLARAAAALPRARFSVLGYFPIFTGRSHEKAMRRFHNQGLGLNAPVTARNRSRYVRLSNLWADSSSAALAAVCEQLNATGGRARFTFVPLKLAPGEGLMAGKHSLLWGIPLRDPARNERTEQWLRGGSVPAHGRFASIGHPNRAGEQVYLRSILASLTGVSPADW